LSIAPLRSNAPPSSRDPVTSGRAPVPLNVDDIPVGGYEPPSRGRVADPYERDDVTHEENNFHDPAPAVKSGNKKKAIREEVQDYALDADGDRPIRPKAQQNYLDVDPENPSSNGAGLDADNAAEIFPPGQHPLEGIPNFPELPAPEPLASKNRFVFKCNFTSI
jgi:hypothetical protein